VHVGIQITTHHEFARGICGVDDSQLLDILQDNYHYHLASISNPMDHGTENAGIMLLVRAPRMLRSNHMP
jgi:hypothetical protein